MRKLLLLFLFIPFLASSQKLIVQVLDEAFKPIPYSSVSWSPRLGLVTDSMGYVEIPDRSQIDSLVIYSLGFEKKVVSLSELSSLPDLIVILKNNIIELPEVIVWKQSIFKEFGVTVKKEGYTYFKSSICTNFQLAVKMEGFKSPAKLNAVSVYISSASSNVTPFRIRVYETDGGGLPGKDLLNENIIVINYKKYQWNLIDLSSYNFGKLPEQGFFVSLEPLCTDLKEHSGLCIAGTDEISTAITYYKNGNSNWKHFDSKSKRHRPTNFLIKVILDFPAK